MMTMLEIVNLYLHPRLKNGGMYGGSPTVAGTVECNDIGHWRFLPHFKMGVSSPGLIMNAVVPGNEGIGDKSSPIMPERKDMRRKAGYSIVRRNARNTGR